MDGPAVMGYPQTPSIPQIPVDVWNWTDWELNNDTSQMNDSGLVRAAAEPMTC